MIEFIIEFLNALGNVDDGIESVLSPKAFEELCNLVGSMYGDMIQNRVQESFVLRENGYHCIMENCGDEAFVGVIPDDDDDDDDTIFLSDCRNEELVIELFGSVSEFARLVEQNGNNFTHGNWVVTYDEDSDIHHFTEKP